MVEQLSFFSSSSSDGNVPYVKHTGALYESVGVGLSKYPTLMGTFPLPPPHVASVNMMLVKSDPWVIPPRDQVDAFDDGMPLSPTEINYVEIVSASTSISTNHTTLGTYLDTYYQSPWLGSSDSSNPLIENFPTNKSIMEIMSLEEAPWNDTHHHSSFLPGQEVISTCLENFYPRFLDETLFLISTLDP